MIERYTRPEMGQIWTLENRYKAWLRVELAVCEAWCQEGKVPAGALANIKAKAAIDVDRILTIEETTRHDVIAFLTSLEEKIGPDARFIHLGCTSSDIVDTAGALLLVQSGRLILQDLDALLETLRSMAFKYKGALCIGRSHGVHAEPTSFGLKMTGFYAEFVRHRARIADAIEDIRVGKISGAVGTYTIVSPSIEKKALDILGLKVDPHSTQIVQRDRYAHFFSAIAIMAGGIERLCVELRHLQRTEVLEVEEGFAKGQKGSSAMPHKKNPISAENLCGLSRVMRSNSLAALEDQALWHERDISHSSVERIIMPDSTILADYALNRLRRLLANLVVHEDRMLENMDRSYGLYFSQRVLTALIEANHPRQKSYEAVQRLAMQSWTERRSFPELVKADSQIVGILGKEALEKLFDPMFYLHHEDDIYRRVFGTVSGDASMNIEYKRRLARLLVAKSYREGDFLLASGRHSDYYFDCRVTALHAEGAWLIGNLFFEMIKGMIDAGTPVKGIGGMTMGADPLVSATTVISQEKGLPLNGLLVRKEAKGHGTNQFVEGMGNFDKGDPVVVVEDVVTTGGSLLKACQRIEAAGLKIVGVCSILDREEGGREKLKDAGYELKAIFTRRELLEHAKD